MSWIGALVRTALMAGLAYYEWRRLVRDTGLRGAPRIAVTAAIAASVTPLVLGGIASGGGVPRLSGPIAGPGFLGWAGFALVWPWQYLAAAQQGGLLAGRYRRGPTELYVSRGAGYWGPPVRFAAPAELTRVILRAG